MEEKRKPYLTISVRQPRHSFTILVILLSIGVIAGSIGIQELQRWQQQRLETEARLQDTEADLVDTENQLQETRANLQAIEIRLQETEVELLDAKIKLESYLPITSLSEPIAFISTSWGIDSITCILMPQGFWTGWGTQLGIGRLLFYYARKWDSVEAIDESGQYILLGEDEWAADWDAEEGYANRAYYTHVAVQESHPFTWSDSKGWFNNSESWERRLIDYCREVLQP